MLNEDSPLVLILPGNDVPEMRFICQLLESSVEAAAGVSAMDFIQPFRRPKSGRVLLSCVNAAAMAEFDESVYAYVPIGEVDRFISDHVIDKTTLRLAESFAMESVLGSAGSTIAEDLRLDPLPEFIFKDSAETAHRVTKREEQFLVYQPIGIPATIQEQIISDLEKKRSLSEVRDMLISVIDFLLQDTEPLNIRHRRSSPISEVVRELMRQGVLTERHVSNATIAVLNSHLKLEVCHATSLLKGVCSRMKGDDVFGGRIREGWNTMLPE